jgi:ribosomal protein S15P/S13E
MQCKDFEAVLEQEGLHPLPLAARSHLAECSACQNLFADLSVIVSTAKVLPAEVDPPERLWVSLRAQMEAEGLIKDSVPVPAEKAAWWQGLSTLFRPRVLAMAGAGLVLAFAAFLTVHKNPGTGTRTTLPVPVAVTQVPTPAQPEATRPSSAAAVAAAPAPQVTARGKSPSSPVPATSHGLKPSPTDNLYGAGTLVGTQDPEQFPAGASLRGSVEADASLRDNLRVINEVIAECQKHLKKHPNDELAREYLASAYQQKAQLVAAILDSGRSEQ